MHYFVSIMVQIFLSLLFSDSLHIKLLTLYQILVIFFHFYCKHSLFIVSYMNVFTNQSYA